MKIIKNKLFKVLIVLFILGFVLGIISYLLLDVENNSIINYFSLLKDNKFNYFNGFINSIKYNYKYAFLLWIFGICLFLSFIIPFIIIYRGISVGFTLFSIIYTFKLKGLIMALILVFPVILVNELIFILLSYYAIKFSYREFNIIKNNKSINLKSFIKNYFIIFIIFLGVLLLNSIFEIYISSNIIKFVI